MKTRPLNLPQGFGFEYAEPGSWPVRWRTLGGHNAPRTWPTAKQRDQARACFSRRRSVERALDDLVLRECAGDTA